MTCSILGWLIRRKKKKAKKEEGGQKKKANEILPDHQRKKDDRAGFSFRRREKKKKRKRGRGNGKGTRASRCLLNNETEWACSPNLYLKKKEERTKSRIPPPLMKKKGAPDLLHRGKKNGTNLRGKKGNALLLLPPHWEAS